MMMEMPHRQPRLPLRWILIAVGLTALQAAVIVVLSDRTPPEQALPRTVPKVRVAGWEQTSLVADPRLLALPTAQGFAGVGWRIASNPGYEPQDWTEPMPWLGQSETGLARTLLSAPVVGIGRGVTADKPAPNLATHVLPVLPLAEATVVRLESGRSHWEWVEPLTAPTIVHSNILSDTVIQVTLDPAGQVFSAVVLKSSGLKSADQQALSVVRGARFRRAVLGAEAGEWDWPRVIFEWRTEAAGSSATESTARGS